MSTNSVDLKELHKDLARKYEIHKQRIEQIWRAFDAKQREDAFKAGAMDGVVLKHSSDRELGDVYKIIPEMNLSDVAQSGPDFLLNHMKHRATKTLFQQYCEGADGGEGDHKFISRSMMINNLRHVNRFERSFTMFLDDDNYGNSFSVPNKAQWDQTKANLSSAVQAGLCVAQETGEFILMRQTQIMQHLNILIEDILDQGSTSKSSKPRSKKSGEAATTALSNLSITSKPEKSSPHELIARALNQKADLVDYLDLCCNEPVFLAHAVNIWFFTNPELVKDDRGRIIPVIRDKYISAAIFDVINNSVAAAATWNYIHRLLTLWDENRDKKLRGVILQELSNLCQWEYSRAQRIFKRYVQLGTGSKHFKRIPNVYDHGTARVLMKSNPNSVTREDLQLYYMLRLCQPETNASKAVDWIKKLDELHQSRPLERERMEEREFEAFGDLAVITSFTQSVSTSISLPSTSNKNGQMFLSKLKSLANELQPLRMQIDLGDFAIPIDNLTNPGMAEAALNALEQFFIDKVGTKIGFLYQDMIEECVADIQAASQQQEGNVIDETMVVLPQTQPSPGGESSQAEALIQQRRQKEKTRPAHSSIYATSSNAAVPMEEEPPATVQAFKVKQTTMDFFSTLFSKSQARGSVNWIAFEAAMVDLQFSVVPKLGSVYAFVPSENMGVKRPLVIHRPHKSRIEGYMLLYLARRLKQVYGWGERSFVLA